MTSTQSRIPVQVPQDGARVRDVEADLRRASVGDVRTGASTDPEVRRAAGLLFRRDLLDRLRHRGDPVRGRRRCVERRARARRPDPDLDRGRDPARDRGDVVPPDDLRLPERGWLVRRQSREPRREPVARRRRIIARRLHPHRCGLDLRRRRRDHLDPAVRRPRRTPRRARARADPADHAREPARVEGVGPVVRVPDLPVHRDPDRARRARPEQVVLRVVRRHRPDPVRSRSIGGGARSRRHPRLVPDPQGLLFGRGRAHGCRGDLERRPRFPATGVEERGDDPHRDGVDPRHVVLRGVGARAPPAPVPESRRDGLRPDGSAGVRRQRRVLDPAARNRRHPHARRQHRLCRLPPFDVDHRRRRLSPASAHEPR